jgi:hypothetical protein
MSVLMFYRESRKELEIAAACNCRTDNALTVYTEF